MVWLLLVASLSMPSSRKAFWVGRWPEILKVVSFNSDQAGTSWVLETSSPTAKKLRLKSGRFLSWLLVITVLIELESLSIGAFADSTVAEAFCAVDALPADWPSCGGVDEGCWVDAETPDCGFASETKATIGLTPST